MASNALNLTREQLNIITGGDPRAIRAFEDFFLAINNLGSHAATHEPGGSDPLTVDAVAAIGSLRTLGVGAQKAAAGIHGATHVTGGGDTVADAVAGGNSGLMSGADKTKLDTGVAPLPKTGAGVGQIVLVNPGAGVGWTLPAGGTWMYAGALYQPTGTWTPGAAYSFAGVAAGSTVISIGYAGCFWYGFVWRIA